MSGEVAVSQRTAGELARRVGGALDGDADAAFVAVTTDSRKSRAGAAFFALDGAQSRGMQFVPAAFGSGCSVVVVPREWMGSVPAGCAAIRHASPLVALASLAADVRREWTGPVVAITGSSGKTTVKEMTAHALSGSWDVLRSPGNYNTVVGLAETVLNLGQPPECAVLEVGASRRGEIARLAAIVQPNVAVVTNVGAAHLDGFGDLDGVANEKLSLFDAIRPQGTCILDGDDAELVRRATARRVVARRVGFAASNDWWAEHVETSSSGSRFVVNGSLAAELSVPGAHQVKNALFAAACAEALGVSREVAFARLRSFRGVSGRLTILNSGGITVVDDTYNSNPVSVRAALNWFAEFATPAPEGRKAVVLGDMLELGPRSTQFHTEMGAWAAGLAPDFVVFVGNESRAAFEEGTRRLGDRPRLRHVPDSEKAASLVSEWVRPGDAVLVKGSRGMKMERVVRALVGEGDSHAV
jgi:UDP-N-acetylmuramoyl-tripeptide--D-alanyl-D-alanine ligase